MYDVIIIGAGPSGLTASIYAIRAGLKVLVLEAKTYGGQIVNASTIENYPGLFNISGVDFALNLFNQANSIGANIKMEEVIGIENSDDLKKVITKDNTYETKSIIIATGCENKRLGLPNEEKFIGSGLSYCATCDGAFFKDQDVAVVGGGNTALEDALYLSNIVKKVYLIHRRDEFRGEKKYVLELKNRHNIEFILNSEVTKLIGNEKLEAIEINHQNVIGINALFVAIGQVPKNDHFKQLLNTDEFGYIIALEDCKTNIDGIFVAGDLRKKDIRQLTTAVSDGAISAMNVIDYLNKK